MDNLVVIKRSDQDAVSVDTQHLNQYQLSKRWNISQRTLERWRWDKKGVAYIKIGNRVVYRLSDVEAYEGQNLHSADGDS